MRARPRGDDCGAAGLVATLITLCLTAVVCTGLPAATSIALTSSRARQAADAVALAVLAASPLAGPAGTASGRPGHGRPAEPDLALADRVARANGAVLRDVDTAGWPLAVVATVEVPVPGGLARMARPILASAAAQLEPP